MSPRTGILLQVVLVFALPLIAAGPVQAAQGNPCDQPANPVVAENCQPGTENWKVSHYSYDLSGFASQSSVNAGEGITFFVTTPTKSFDLQIYRLGYYAGLGGRLAAEVNDLPGRLQPPCRLDASTGLRSCSNWRASYTLQVPASWISGIYVAKFILPGDTGENYTVFVVRQDNRDSTILYQQSFTTSQAYNNYGDKSLYSQNSSPCLTVSAAPRAVKVSFDRPFSAPMGDPSTFFRVEYPMVRWLEAQGYDVTYSTSLDTHHSGQSGSHNELLDHKIFLDVGHDEYWTNEMRTAITQARNAGVHLGFFTANTGYWKVRLEPDPWTGEPDRVMVGYKTTESGQPDPSGDPTTTWRDPQGANEPENALMGIAYIGDNDSLYFPLRVTAEQAADRLFRSTGLQGMPPGSYVDIGKELIGWEWDAVIDNGYTPQGLTVLAASPVTGGLLADAGRLRRPGAAFADTARYIAPSGAIVFTSGTIQWSWGLDLFEPDRRIQQITYNLLSDMGAQPVTPARDLVLDGEPISQIPTVESKTLTYGGPVIAGLQSRAVGRSVEFTWLTDQPALGQVWIVDPNGMVSMPAGEKVRTAHEDKYTTSHQLSFNGLPPVTEMHYQVLSTSESGYTTVSGVQDFTTGQASPKDRVVLALTPLKNQVVCEVKPALQNIKWQVRSQPILAGFAALAVFTASGVAILGVVRRAKSNRG